MDRKRAEDAVPLALSPRVMATALEFTRAKFTARQIALPVFALAAAGLLRQSADSLPLTIWTCANLLCAVTWFLLDHLVLKPSAPGLHPLRKILVFALFLLISAGAWASIAPIAWVPGDRDNNYLLLMMLTGEISVMVFTLSPILFLTAAGALPSLVLMICVPLLKGMNHGAEMVTLSVVYVAVLGSVATIMRFKSLESIRLREERADLVEDLTARNSQAERERDEARGVNQSTARLVIQIAHDLRTPLNAIMGFSEIIRDEMLGPLGQSPYRRLGTDIYNSGIELLSSIDHLQQVLKLESGQIELAPERLRLELAFARAIRAAGPQAEARQVTLKAHAPPTLPRLWADEKILASLLDHLVGHAIQRCWEGGVVSMSAGLASNGGLAIRVLSSEPIGGVSGSAALSSAATVSDGPALWRQIAQGFAELHGGTLTVEDRDNGGELLQIEFPPERTISAEGDHAGGAAA